MPFEARNQLIRRQLCPLLHATGSGRSGQQAVHETVRTGSTADAFPGFLRRLPSILVSNTKQSNKEFCIVKLSIRAFA